MSSFSFVHLPWGMQSTIKSSVFSQWDSLKRIKLSFVRGYQLIGVCFRVKIEGICPFLLLLPEFHLVEVLGMLLQSLCFDAADLEGLVFFICPPPFLSHTYLLLFLLISLSTQERDLMKTFHLGLSLSGLGSLYLLPSSGGRNTPWG